MDLARRSTVEAIVHARDLSLAKMAEAADAILVARQMAQKAQSDGMHATGGSIYYPADRSKSEAYQRLLMEIDPAKSMASYRQHLDACTWMNVMKLTGADDLMDRKARDEFYAALSKDVPEITFDNVMATLEGLLNDADMIFGRGVARVFSELDRRFKSHDGFKIGARVVLTNVFDQFGEWSFHGRTRELLADIDRVFIQLDKAKGASVTATASAVDRDRGHGFKPRQSETDGVYYRVKGFKNGNAHLWFKDDALVDEVNKVLAAYYGEVLPEVPPEANSTQARDLFSRAGALSRDLAFYPSPEPVVARLLEEVHLDNAVVLEPSAGTGSIVRALLNWRPTEYGHSQGYGPVRSVHAIEFDRGRASQITGDSRLRVTVGNFLLTPASPTYTHVVMNPPFEGTHWMQHVMHAYDFLAPGGVLVAVLPMSAEVNESAAHEAFREWAHSRKQDWQMFRELPPESFKSVGTRINTVILRLKRKQ